MAYYPDLSPYTYYLRPQKPTAIEKAYPDALNIGWLGRAHPFPRSTTLPEESLLKRLLAHTVLSVLMMRGIHDCHLCLENSTDLHGTSLFYEDQEIVMDNGEILVVGVDGIAFRAPTMLYHYITEHQYQPPDVFWEALRTSSPTLGDELEEAVRVPFQDDAFEKKRRAEKQEAREFAMQLIHPLEHL